MENDPPCGAAKQKILASPFHILNDLSGTVPFDLRRYGTA
jgi:hypothetical protein